MAEPSAVLHTKERGIVIEDHPFDRGYWARYDDQPREQVLERGGKAGWDACNGELRGEAKAAKRDNG